MTTLNDPYFAELVPTKFSRFGRAKSGPSASLAAWIVVYLINLVVPLSLAWEMTCNAGRTGMCLGMLMTFGIGIRVGFATPRTLMTVTFGGWIVAISQLFPIVQIFSGLIGLSVAKLLGQTTNQPNMGLELRGSLNSELGGFVATVITASLLIAIAAVIGFVIRGFLSLIRPKRTELVFGLDPGLPTAR